MAIVVPITGDFSGLTRALGGAGNGLKRFGKIAAIAVGAAVTAELYKSVKAAAEAEKATQTLRQQLQTLHKGDDVAKLTAQFTQLATSLGVDDEAASRAFTTILRLTGSSTKAMEGLNLALDLSANTGFVDLEKQAMVVARAMNGNTRLFKQFGITVDENTTKQEALAIVQRRVQGQSEAFGTSAIGSFNRFNEAVENVRETIGTPLVIALANAASKVATFISSFANKPTLEAKIKFVIGSIGNVAWTGIQSLYTWWNQQGRTELPARVVLTPSGKQQFDQFFRNLEKSARDAGRNAATSFVSAFSGGAGDGFVASLKTLLERWNAYIAFQFRITGVTAVTSFVAGFVEKIGDRLGVIGDAIMPAGKAIGDILDRATRRGGKSIRNNITTAVKDAVQSARQSLQGLGADIASTISTMQGMTFRLPGGKNAAEITAEQRAIEDERLKLEEQRLKDAAAATDATEEDKLNLRQFYLDKEMTLRDRALADEEAKNKRSIDDLIEQFNRGLISAQSFNDSLGAIIGSARGEELGMGFAGAFIRQIEALKIAVADIFAVVGQSTPISSGGTPVQDSLRAENQRRFDEYTASWEKTRDNLIERIQNNQKIIKDQDSTAGQKAAAKKRLQDLEAQLANHRKTKKPRSDFGLAMGGILKTQVFTAAEAGPEAILPLRGKGGDILRDAIGMNNQPSGGATYNVTVNAGLGTDPDELSRVIVQSIKRFEKRNGQVFSGPLLGTTTNVLGKIDPSSGASSYNRPKTLRKN